MSRETCAAVRQVYKLEKIKKNSKAVTSISRSLRVCKSMSAVIQVLFGLETFWSHLDLSTLALLSRVKKDCDIYFAVRQMSKIKDKPVTKVWAQRWLGLSAGWVHKIQNLTLMMALNIAKEHGGIAKTYKRGIELRNKEAAKEAKRLKAVADEAARSAQGDMFVADVRLALSTLMVPSNYFGNETIKEYYYEMRMVDETATLLFDKYNDEFMEEQALTLLNMELKRKVKDMQAATKQMDELQTEIERREKAFEKVIRRRQFDRVSCAQS